QAEPPPLERFRKDVPPAIEQVLRRMLTKRPEDRFQTPGEVAAALTSLIPSNVHGAKRAAGFSLAVPRSALRWFGAVLQNRRGRLAAGGVGLLLVALLVYFVGSPSGPPPKEQTPLDLLEPASIPAKIRPPQPVEGLVAVLGDPGGAP